MREKIMSILVLLIFLLNMSVVPATAKEADILNEHFDEFGKWKVTNPGPLVGNSTAFFNTSGTESENLYQMLPKLTRKYTSVFRVRINHTIDNAKFNVITYDGTTRVFLTISPNRISYWEKLGMKYDNNIKNETGKWYTWKVEADNGFAIIYRSEDGKKFKKVVDRHELNAKNDPPKVQITAEQSKNMSVDVDYIAIASFSDISVNESPKAGILTDELKAKLPNIETNEEDEFNPKSERFEEGFETAEKWKLSNPGPVVESGILKFNTTTSGVESAIFNLENISKTYVLEFKSMLNHNISNAKFSVAVYDGGKRLFLTISPNKLSYWAGNAVKYDNNIVSEVGKWYLWRINVDNGKATIYRSDPDGVEVKRITDEFALNEKGDAPRVQIFAEQNTGIAASIDYIKIWNGSSIVLGHPSLSGGNSSSMAFFDEGFDNLTRWQVIGISPQVVSNTLFFNTLNDSASGIFVAQKIPQSYLLEFKMKLLHTISEGKVVLSVCDGKQRLFLSVYPTRIEYLSKDGVLSTNNIISEYDKWYVWRVDVRNGLATVYRGDENGKSLTRVSDSYFMEENLKLPKVQIHTEHSEGIKASLDYIRITSRKTNAVNGQSEMGLKDKLVLREGYPIAYVNNEKQIISEQKNLVKPLMLNNVVFIPLRFVATVYNAKVNYIDVNNSVEIVSENEKALIRLGGNDYYINEKQYFAESAPIAIDGSSYVPYSLISQLFNKTVFMDKNGVIVFSEFELTTEEKEMVSKEIAGIFDKIE